MSFKVGKMLEQWKQDIETTYGNQQEARKIKPDTNKEAMRLHRYDVNCRNEIDQYVRLIGREVAGRYIRTNREAYEIGEEWLNSQGVEL